MTAVLPVRDAVGTIEAAVTSLLAQRLPSGHQADLTVTVVDDGSTDGTSEVLAKMAARHRQLDVLTTPARGLPQALNLGIETAESELILRMDADDLCHPERLAQQLAELAKHPEVAALGCQVELFPDAQVAGGMRAYAAWQNGLVTPRQHAQQLFVESPLCHPSVLLRKSAWASVGGYRDGPFPEDYDLWLRLDAAGFGLAKVPLRLLSWRQGPARATVTDPRYAPERFLACKAPFLARRLKTRPGPITLWGAGKTGKRVARALEAHGVQVERFIDIDARKLGRRARGAPIEPPSALEEMRSNWTLVAVGARGARDLVRSHLESIGYREGTDFLCAA